MAGLSTLAPELHELLLPVYEADLQLVRSYAHQPAPLLDCPITALGGAADPLVDRPALAGWQRLTTADFALHVLPGGHLFLRTERPRLLSLLRDHLPAAAP